MSTSLSTIPPLLRQNLTRLTTRLTALSRTRKPLLVALTASLVGALALLRAAYLDYLQFLSYGPGGVPYNPLGWFLSGVVLRPIGVHVTDTAPFAADANQTTFLGTSWAENVGKRNGGVRPAIGPHPIPQRQLDQHSSAAVRDKFLMGFNTLADYNGKIVELAPSKYEGHTEAMWVQPGSAYHAYPGSREAISREISHVHATGDYSAHVVLAPADAKMVIDAGWGQLHPLAGVKFLKLLRKGRMLPREYVMLYAPRDEREIGIALGIIRAGMEWMTGEDVGMVEVV